LEKRKGVGIRRILQVRTLLRPGRAHSANWATRPQDASGAELSSNWRQDAAITGRLEACRYGFLVLATVDWMFRLLALMTQMRSRFVAIEYGC